MTKYNSVITLQIPDIDVVVKGDEAELRNWVSTTLSEVLVARLVSLKATNDALKEATSRSVVIDDPELDTRGIGVVMGGLRN